MAELNSTTVHGSLRVANKINANEILKKDKPVLSEENISNTTKLSESGIETTTNGKTYSVRLDKNENLVVNVPWSDNNTWKENTKTSEGYIPKGDGHTNKVWKTDTTGTPGWRDEESETFNNPDGCTETVGGIKPGTTFDNMPIKDIIQKMLYKYYAPSITGLSISSSTNNNYYGGSLTVKSFTVTINKGTGAPTFKSLTATFDGQTYTASSPSFSGKTCSYTFDISPDKVYTGTGSTTRYSKDAVVTCVLNNGTEAGAEATLTRKANVSANFNNSDFWYGATTANNSIAGLTKNTNKSGWPQAELRIVFDCTKNFPTIICPATWGNKITVVDGAKNPVTGVFSKVNTITIQNVNKYSETYNVFQSNSAATGKVAYLFTISA